MDRATLIGRRSVFFFWVLSGLVMASPKVFSGPMNSHLEDEEVSTYLDELTRAPETLNRVTILNLGKTSRPARLNMIAQAQKFILFKAPYWFNDGAGREQVEALRNLSEERPNVDIKVFFDWLTPAQSKQFWKSPIRDSLLEITNDQVRVWNSLWWQRTFSFGVLSNRMHDKVFVVDGTRAIIGGINISDKYLYGGDLRDGWHDTDLLIEGPGVREITRYYLTTWELSEMFASTISFPPSAKMRTKLLQSVFFDQKEDFSWQQLGNTSHQDPRKWLETRSVSVKFRSKYPGYYPELTDEEKNFKSPVRIIYDNRLVDRNSDTGESFSKIAESVRYLLSQSESSVRAMVPYMSLRKDMKQAFENAARRGVKVQIITNSLKSNDLGKRAYLGSAYDILELLRAGVEVYEWQGHFPLFEVEAANSCVVDGGWYGHTIHTKGIVFDEQVVIVGSHNLNVRSEFYNNEIAALINDSEKADEFDKIFENNLDKIEDKRFVSCGGKNYPRGSKVKKLNLAEYEKFYKENKFLIDLYRKLKKLM